MKVAFYRDALLGDHLVAIDAMFALKALYPSCNLIVYTNQIGIELYKNYDFIDAFCNMDSLSKEEIQAHINAHHFDFFILTQANRWRCKLINQTNAKKVITFLSAGSIFKKKFHNLFISRNFNSMPQYQRILQLIKAINPKHFDQHFKDIDFSPTILKTKPKHQEMIQKFLMPFGHYRTLVMINPFSRTCSHNLSLNGWLTLAQNLSFKYPHILFILATYEANPQDINLSKQNPNLVVFKNTSDIFNLIELTKHLFLLISPSTGNAHIADNLHIPLLGLFSKRDTMLWRGRNMQLENLIIIPCKKEKMTLKIEQNLIKKVMQKFQDILEQP